jgi:hypothetical protein
VHNSTIEYYLSQLGIHKIEIQKDYDIEEVEKIIQSELITSNKFKTKFSLVNDAIMLEFLADNDPDVNPLQPVGIKLYLKLEKSILRNFRMLNDGLCLPRVN